MAKTTSRQTVKKRRTHDRIIASAGRIVRKNGLAAASVSRVMHGALPVLKTSMRFGANPHES